MRSPSRNGQEFIWFLLPLLKHQLQMEERETSALPTSINLEAILENIQQEGERTLTSNPALGKLRLYFAIVLTVIPAENTTLLTQWYLMWGRSTTSLHGC